ncbi:glycerol 3-phosphate dehydrogenase (NAD(P)+) [Clostridium acidisoli DSM 12555]|uniref:Glycerol-3-phosphate dehydrogenase [NAD(P)+] n=1 Tax=Clostridium acidisoli DSM 12555 TaxID=1121291 RepID=A0A1W1XCK4_9CLOT|nr:NAD(P)H-dependent glycerol-3-phosphate dehydrogenase [Clostridium acidisoli]SMC21570.1 glycerol 3-phosphate dehydrogenase (NAD(P)+) [Clostridium acidisoli DSM 12555]
MEGVTFLGMGSFGTSLGILLAKNQCKVTIWGRNDKEVEEVKATRVNNRYLPEVEIPKDVLITSDIKEAIRDSEYIVLAVPSYAIRSVCKLISKELNEKQILISIAKGIEEGTNLRLSQVIKDEAPLNPVVVLTGPSHAEEVSRNIPTAVVVSSADMKYAYKVQDLFMTKYFRVYTNDDIIGTEIGGAVKNIIALTCGICDGLGYGDNTRAALMTRGMSEIVKIGTLLGGKKETFYGLTGMGDLIVTCTSLHSRNRRAGIQIGKGVPIKEACENIGMVVEGISACDAFYKLKEKLNVCMPIVDELYQILFKNKDIKDAAHSLMSRDRKNEIH